MRAMCAIDGFAMAAREPQKRDAYLFFNKNISQISDLRSQPHQKSKLIYSVVSYTFRRLRLEYYGDLALSIIIMTFSSHQNTEKVDDEASCSTIEQQPPQTTKKISRKKRKWLKKQQEELVQQHDDKAKFWYTIFIDVDKSKFFDPEYAVLEGDIQADVTVDDENEEKDETNQQQQQQPVLKRGERVFVMCRGGQVRRLHETLVGESLLEERKREQSSKPYTTGWLRHELYGLQVAVRLPLGGGPSWNASYLSLNRRGIKCLDLPGEFVGVFDQDMIDAAQSKQPHARRDKIGSILSSDDDEPIISSPSSLFTADKDDILTIRQSDLQERLTRHRHFANWLIRTFGMEQLNTGSGVLDVAGGNGKLSSALIQLGVTSCTILDPQPLYSSRDRILVIPQPLEGDGSALTDDDNNDDYDHAERIRNCSIVVGLHPDQATEAVVDLALRLGKPFAVSPCCTMTKLFPHRTNIRTGDPVRTVWALCRYLLDKAPATSPFQVDFLPFAGRNKVIWWGGPRSDLGYCREVTNGADADAEPTIRLDCN
jgi:hypothetical protein